VAPDSGRILYFQPDLDRRRFRRRLDSSFSVSVLGFGGPAVSPTNLLYNIVAIPTGVYRYYREKRMVWPLTWTIIVGTLPGILVGAVIRIKYLPDHVPSNFFAGIVLAYVGFRLFLDLFKKVNRKPLIPKRMEISM